MLLYIYIYVRLTHNDIENQRIIDLTRNKTSIYIKIQIYFILQNARK